MRFRWLFLKLVYQFRRLFFPVVQYRFIFFLMLISAVISLLISLSTQQSTRSSSENVLPIRTAQSNISYNQYPPIAENRTKRDWMSHLPETIQKNIIDAVNTTSTSSTTASTTTSTSRTPILKRRRTTTRSTSRAVAWNMKETTALSMTPANHSLALNQSSNTVIDDPAVRYSFIDIRSLNVKTEYLDQVYHPPADLKIDYPSAGTHYLSRIVTVKGDPSLVFYNRMPHCHEFTMHYLMQNVSFLHSFPYVSSEIYIPFSYNGPSLLAIARSLGSGERDRLFYDRHIYFFDYYALQLPLHPVWINLVKDPISRIALEYQRSREFCQNSPQCFVRQDLLNETLDQCVAHRSPRECISVASGVSRMLPFFCGLKEPLRCQDENDWAFQQAKENIEFYYTVVGFAEDFYKFLYVLEKLLPQYFKLARLIFMNQWDPRKLADDRDINAISPDPRTAEILRPLLHFEYQLYDFVKQRFFEQYHLLVELDH